MPEVTPQTAQTTQTFQTLVEAWELKKILKVVSITDAGVTIMPLGEKYSARLVRFESLSNDRIALTAVDTVGLFNKLSYSIMIDSEDVKKMLKVIPWSRMLVRVIFNGATIQVHSMDGTVSVEGTIVEKPESIMSGLVEQLKEWHPRAVMKSNASTLLSWLKPFATVGDARAHFKMLYNGFMIDKDNEGASMMLDVKFISGEYEADGIFEVGYNLKYVTEFLEEVKRGSVNVVFGQDKPMIVESELESKASVETIARIVQAPMVE
jgi:hypothetical protein